MPGPHAVGTGSLPSRPRRIARGGGFSLVELLAALAVVAVLVTLASVAVTGSSRKVKTAQCVSKLRALGSAALLWSNDHDGQLPRSLHSAGGAGVDSWTYAVAPYLGLALPMSAADWEVAFERHYRCPSDPNRSVARWSYGLNVHFELTPDGDDYEGSPATWSRLSTVPRPGRTILMAEPRSVDYADHVMAHLWGSDAAARNALDYRRHTPGATYLFVDGHAEMLPIPSVYSRAAGVNQFNPGLAR